MNYLQKLKNELAIAKRLESGLKKEYPGFKDLINPIFDIAASNNFLIVMPSINLHTEKLMKENKGRSERILGIPTKDLFGADLMHTSRMHILLPDGKPYCYITQYHAPVGKEVDYRGFRFEDYVGVETRQHTRRPVMIQRIETFGPENRIKMTIAVDMKNTGDMAGLTLKSKPAYPDRENPPLNMKAKLHFGGSDKMSREEFSLKVLNPVYAYVLDHIEKLQTPDFYAFLPKFINYTTWFKLSHNRAAPFYNDAGKNMFSDRSSYYYELKIVSFGAVSETIKKNTEGARDIINAQRQFSKEKDSSETTTINWQLPDKAFPDVKPGEKRGAVLEAYLKKFEFNRQKQ